MHPNVAVVGVFEVEGLVTFVALVFLHRLVSELVRFQKEFRRRSEPAFVANEACMKIVR